MLFVDCIYKTVLLSCDGQDDEFSLIIKCEPLQENYVLVGVISDHFQDFGPNNVAKYP
jgi:hypothetical protein